MKYTKNSYCSFCGTAFAPDQAWPRTCGRCQQISYLNPLPVVVMIVPVIGRGVLLIRRNIEPRLGQLALPGGFLEVGESWQMGGVREVREEVGLELDPAGVKIFEVLSTPDTHSVLIFGRVPPIPAEQLQQLTLSAEVSEIVITDEPLNLAFPLHTHILSRVLEGGL